MAIWKSSRAYRARCIAPGTLIRRRLQGDEGVKVPYGRGHATKAQFPPTVQSAELCVGMPRIVCPGPEGVCEAQKSLQAVTTCDRSVSKCVQAVLSLHEQQTCSGQVSHSGHDPPPPPPWPFPLPLRFLRRLSESAATMPGTAHSNPAATPLTPRPKPRRVQASNRPLSIMGSPFASDSSRSVKKAPLLSLETTSTDGNM